MKKDVINKFLPQKVKSLIKLFKPARILLAYENVNDLIYEKYLILSQPFFHMKALKKVRKKDTIKVVFFALFPAMWKYDELYKLLLENDQFEPLIVICPIVAYGDKYMQKTSDECYAFFLGKNYNVVIAYDKINNRYLDVKNDISPDIIFFTDPYKGLVDKRYFITEFRDVLTCYTRYSFSMIKYPYTYNLLFHNLLWAFFIESNENKKFAKSISSTKGRNFIVSGYPIMDEFNRKEKQGVVDLWLNGDSHLKRIIFAPHHTIPKKDSVIHLSTFMLYYKDMLVLAKKYTKQIQIIFRPHPELKIHLSDELIWGKEKTELYYNEWRNLENGQLYEGANYVDLFLTSDAMIHDCGGFAAEYLYTNKPVMFLANNDPMSQLNPVGLMAHKCHYYGYNVEDIENFISEVVIKGKDILKGQREQFKQKILTPPNNKSASENIMNYLINKCLKK